MKYARVKKIKKHAYGDSINDPNLEFMQNNDYDYNPRNPNQYTASGNPNPGNFQAPNRGVSSNMNSPSGNKYLGTVGALANVAGSYIDQISYDKDTNIQNTTAAAGAGALKGAATGAAAGSVIGPWGTAIGGAVGAIGGGIAGFVSAKNSNEQAQTANDQAFQQRKTAYLDNYKANQAYKKSQDDSYNQAYYATNNTNGNGSSIYAKYGGRINKYPNGGTMSPSEWNAYNEKQGYMLHPKLVNSGVKDSSNSYNSYYDPNKFTPGYNPDGSVRWSKNGDPNYNFQTGMETPVIQYIAPQKMLPGNTYMQDTAKQSNDVSVNAHGGTIHIKPSHRGKFTEYKERTGKTTEEALHSSDPHVRKMANFARNAAKWYHADGGHIMESGGGTPEGGDLNPIASDVVKAEGNTHAEGGITLHHNGKPFAEVEDQEVIKGNDVYSDRIKLNNGNTVAEEALKYAKVKGKNEKYLNSSDYRQKNSSNRKVDFADQKLDELFQLQEASKNPVMNGGRQFAGGGDLMDAAQLVVPYIDNLYNANLINQTPDIPLPTQKVAYYAKAMPMKTSYDVSANLSDANNAYRSFQTNIDQNTSSANVARAGKAVAFADLLNNKSQIYNTKNNVETQLTNQNSKNIQDMNNYNTQNAQNIANTNLGQTDQYNYAKMQRAEDILHMKSTNVADAVNNATTQIQDYNSRKLDQQRMILDAQRYPDGSGFARLIGTPTGDQLFSNKDYYNQAEQALIKAGQNDALAKLRQRYRRNN